MYERGVSILENTYIYIYDGVRGVCKRLIFLSVFFYSFSSSFVRYGVLTTLARRVNQVGSQDIKNASKVNARRIFVRYCSVQYARPVFTVSTRNVFRTLDPNERDDTYDTRYVGHGTRHGQKLDANRICST